MVSNDNYVTIEVFNARMDRLEATIEKNIALTQKENAEFREQIKDDIFSFKEDIRKDFDKISSQFALQLVGRRRQILIHVESKILRGIFDGRNVGFEFMRADKIFRNVFKQIRHLDKSRNLKRYASASRRKFAFDFSRL